MLLYILSRTETCVNYDSSVYGQIWSTDTWPAESRGSSNVPTFRVHAEETDLLGSVCLPVELELLPNPARNLRVKLTNGVPGPVLTL